MTSETKAPMTTIKVPVPLRQRVARGAAREGLTAAAFLATLLDDHEREQRFAAVRRAYSAHDGGDGESDDLTAAWDQAGDADLLAAEDSVEDVAGGAAGD